MKRFLLLLPLLAASAAVAQPTGWGLGLTYQPNAYAGRNYMGVIAWTNGAGITMTYDAAHFRWIVSSSGGGGGSGTVTNFQTGNLSPLFTASVANPTTFPSLSFTATGDGNAGHYYGGDNAFHALPASGSGTVTNFSAGNLSPLFTTSVGSPTLNPSLTFSLSSQSANLFFAGPVSGGAASPTFRAIDTNDLPIVPVTKGGTGRSSLDDQQVLIGNGTANVETSPDLTMDTSGHTLTVGASTVTDVAIHGGMHVFNTGTDVEIEPTLKLDSVAPGSLLGVDGLHQVVDADAPIDGNVYARSNGMWTTFSTGGGTGGLTNAIQIVSSNNTIISSTLTNIHFWAGSNTALIFTNRDSGNADIVISSTATGGGGGSGVAGILQRPLETTAAGAITAATSWPDNSLVTMDEEFFGGFTGSGNVGDLGWIVSLASGSVAGLDSSDTTAFGIVQLSSGTGSGNSANIVLRPVGTSSAGSIAPLGVCSNYQGEVRFRLSRTNAQSDVNLGFVFVGSSAFIRTNVFEVSFVYQTNANNCLFTVASPTSTNTATSSVIVDNTNWMTWRYWSTNPGTVYMAINGEPPSVLVYNTDLGANQPTLQCRTDGAVGSSTLVDIDRFSFRIQGVRP